MTRFVRSLAAASAAFCLLASLSPAMAQQTDTGLFLNILPPGNRGYLNGTDATTFLNDGTLPPNVDDQRPLYENLTYAPQHIAAEDLTSYFKPAPIAKSDNPTTFPQPTRPGISIIRDDYGVPHIEARRRPDVMYGIGFASAVDRLFAMDLARHVGRGHLSEFIGNDPFAFSEDRGIYDFAGYDDADLQQQYNDLIGSSGALGKRADKDLENFVAGINGYITWVNGNTLARAPAEYIGLDKLPIQPFKKIDILSVAVLLEYLFGSGGGGEHTNAILLQKLKATYGSADGAALWHDLRETEDPEAPVTSELSFPYLIQGATNADAIAIPDVDSIVSQDIIEIIGPIPAEQRSIVDVSYLRRRGPHPSMSNVVAVTAENGEGGHPIMVGGPQAGYLVPELLYEFSVNGGGFKTRGVAPLGTPYVVLGRGRTYAWTATAGGSDNTDVRAELLCEPGGGAPTIHSNSYMFKGTCTPMFQRIDTWCVGDTAYCNSHDDNVQATVQRSVHGIIFARATVQGQPVALSRQRASFGKEGLNALAFQRINKNTPTARTFEKAISLAPGSFNWVYVNQDELFYYHSGLMPKRAPGVDFDMPSWGTGEFEWNGFVSTDDHPHELNPPSGYFTSWNNKPARDWRAADSNYSFGTVHRVQMLQKRIADAVANSSPLSPSQVVDIMGEAAFTDLRGQEIVPLALQLIGSAPGLDNVLTLLNDWTLAGSPRRDRDHDGDYDYASAVAVMDAWFQEMIDATVGPQLSAFYSDIPLGFDDKPGAIGSAYQSGYYGLLEKTFRMALGESVADPYEFLKCADGTAAGCRTALVGSLQAAVDSLTAEFSSSNPANWTVDSAAENISFRPFGVAEVDTIPWQNRPTFQQVVQVTDTRLMH